MLRPSFLRPIVLLASLSASSLRTTGGALASFSASNSKSPETMGDKQLVGTTLPKDLLEAKLVTEKKQETTLGSLLSDLPSGYKGLVMFLFPAVDTPFCTKQACNFSTSMDAFNALGYKVYGLTGGSSDAAADWVQKNQLRFSVLLDPEWAVIKHLKCTWMYFMVNRSHVIISRDAKVLALERGVDASKSAERALELLKSMPQ